MWMASLEPKAERRASETRRVEVVAEHEVALKDEAEYVA